MVLQSHNNIPALDYTEVINEQEYGRQDQSEDNSEYEDSKDTVYTKKVLHFPNFPQ